jgi:hypothetical protein
LSPWEIEWVEIPQPESAFTDSDVEIIMKIIKDSGERRPDQNIYFKNRVAEYIAPDYKAVIPAEMYMKLIEERLQNGYYRTT